MKQSINYRAITPESAAALSKVSAILAGSFTDHRLKALVDLRASQINGCAFCVDMHSVEARKLGETQQRLDTLCVWREVSLFEPRERAALALTEALTRVSQHGVPDVVQEEAAKYFSERELVDLVQIIATINAWNRISIAFHAQPPAR